MDTSRAQFACHTSRLRQISLVLSSGRNLRGNCYTMSLSRSWCLTFLIAVHFKKERSCLYLLGIGVALCAWLGLSRITQLPPGLGYIPLELWFDCCISGTLLKASWRFWFCCNCCVLLLWICVYSTGISARMNFFVGVPNGVPERLESIKRFGGWYDIGGPWWRGWNTVGWPWPCVVVKAYVGWYGSVVVTCFGDPV